MWIFSVNFEAAEYAGVFDLYSGVFTPYSGGFESYSGVFESYSVSPKSYSGRYMCLLDEGRYD